jgi:hypothetical protein
MDARPAVSFLFIVITYLSNQGFCDQVTDLRRFDVTYEPFNPVSLDLLNIADVHILTIPESVAVVFPDFDVFGV